MAIKNLFFFAGVVITVLTIKKIIIFHPLWIVLCFGIWLIATYIHIHNRNKDRRTPRPVYAVN